MTQPLSLAFIWHMHQPYYRDLATGECSMPWVRLHATKDYLDMLKRLEPFPSLHQTFNVVPSLLDQLEEYLPPANRTDRFLELSKKDAAQLSAEEQSFIVRWFFLANLERMIKPYPRYHDLLAKRGLHMSEADEPSILKRFHAQDYLDLQVWFNLAWIDPWLRRQDPRLAALEAKGSRFTEADKLYVLAQHQHLMAQIVPAYREAAERGQIELTCSPYYHPIMPLLCDLRAAHVALPQLPLPESSFRHPDDARWHLAEGVRRHHAAFGRLPQGLWPPEGSVNEELVKLALEANIRWIASDEEILWRTLKHPRSPSLLYRPHRLRRGERDLAIVFRDRELSDLIGFVYSQWDPQPAVDDFLRRLEGIRRQVVTATGSPALASIILDGENAWESYPDDGHEFLDRLYSTLARDDRFRCVTVSEFLASHPIGRTESLPELFSGSWIDANFATWVGHQEKNTAWSHLARARDALGALSPASKSLAIAEGSDWMWWFGDTHFSSQAEEFDRLFRTHLANAYTCAGQPVPDSLRTPIRRKLAPQRFDPTGLIHPVIDGVETSYYEWLYAGRVDLQQQYSAIQRSDQHLRHLYYGFDATHLYVRLDLDAAHLARMSAWTMEIALSGTLVQMAPDGSAVRAQVKSTNLPCALGRILEVAVPIDRLSLGAGEKLRLSLSLLQNGKALERYPLHGSFEFPVSAADLDAQAWPL